MTVDAAGMIAVTGAGGWIGGAVLRSLGEKEIPARRVRVDLRAATAEELARAFEGSERVIHAAAHVHVPQETDESRVLFDQINDRGTALVVRACELAGVRRLLFVSTIALYDWNTSAGALGEDAPLAPATAYARSKVAGEAHVREFSGEWTIARLSTVYGRGDRANFARLARALRRHAFLMPGAGDARKSIVPVDHAAEILVRLSMVPDAARQVVNVAAAESPSLRAIVDTFVKECGFNPPRVAPVGLLRVAAMIGDAIALVGRFPLTTRSLSALTTSTVVDSRKMHELLPDLVVPTFDRALRSCADYYREMN